MLWINFKRIIKSGFFNFWRNGFVSLSSVLVMVVTLLVIGSLVFLGAILNSTLEEVKNKVDVNVYFLPLAPEADILTLKSSIENLPEVERVVYVSREEAIENFKARHENDQTTLQALEELGENPLGAALNIKAREPSQYEGIALFLENYQSQGEAIVDKINYHQNKAAIDTLSRIIDSAESLGFIVTLILVVISVVITLNTIRLAIYISREEISIMRLVGASTSYIRGPFLISGMMYGLLAGLATLILFYPITYWLGSVTRNFYIDLNIFEYYTAHFGQMFLIIVGSGILIGAISSYLAVKRYLET